MWNLGKVGTTIYLLVFCTSHSVCMDVHVGAQVLWCLLLLLLLLLLPLIRIPLERSSAVVTVRVIGV